MPLPEESDALRDVGDPSGWQCYLFGQVSGKYAYGSISFYVESLNHVLLCKSDKTANLDNFVLQRFKANKHARAQRELSSPCFPSNSV